MLQVIAENLSTAVVSDLTTLVKSMRDDRRKVRNRLLISQVTLTLGDWGQVISSHPSFHSPLCNLHWTGGGVVSFIQCDTDFIVRAADLAGNIMAFTVSGVCPLSVQRTHTVQAAQTVCSSLIDRYCDHHWTMCP